MPSIRDEVYQELSQGHTDEQLDLAAILRGIARDIESEQYTDWIKTGIDLEVVLNAIAARAKVYKYRRWMPSKFPPYETDTTNSVSCKYEDCILWN